MSRAHVHDPAIGLAFHAYITPLVVGLLYFVGAVGTSALTAAGHGIVALWPANAVLLAFLLHLRRGHWGSVLLAGLGADMLANMAIDQNIMASLPYGLITMAEVFLAASILRKRVNIGEILGSYHNAAQFFLWVGLVVPALGTFATTLLSEQAFGTLFLSRFAADALGLLIFTPFLLALLGGHFRHFYDKKSWPRRLEILVLLLLTGVISAAVFSISHLSVLFLIAVPVTAVTIRFGWLFTKVALVIVGGTGALELALGLGAVPVLYDEIVRETLYFQLFLASLQFTQWPLAIAFEARKHLFRQMQNSERSLRELAEHSSILMLTFDLQGVCIKAAGSSALLLGRAAETLPGLGFADLTIDRGHGLSAAHNLAMDMPNELHLAEFEVPGKKGIWLEAKFGALTDDDGRCLGTLATVHNISVRKHHEAELVRLSTTDSLTGLLNRAGFLSRLKQELNNDRRGVLSLAMIDVDRFKLINDNCGHQTGDIVLQEIARRISFEVRSSDAVGRLGGDEFVVLLSTTSLEQAEHVCERVVASISTAPVKLPSGETMHTAISCGLSKYVPGISAEDLLHEADLALYTAKRGGRNQFVSA